MPMESKAQNAAMHAAAEGKSTLGIPKKVARKFVAESHGQNIKKLPEHASQPKPKTNPGDYDLVGTSEAYHGAGKPDLIGSGSKKSKPKTSDPFASISIFSFGGSEKPVSHVTQRHRGSWHQPSAPSAAGFGQTKSGALRLSGHSGAHRIGAKKK